MIPSAKPRPHTLALAAAVCLLAPAAPAETLRGSFPFTYSGGTNVAAFQAPLTLSIAPPGVFDPDAPKLEAQIDSGSDGADFVFDSGSSGFADFAAALTNGVDDRIQTKFMGSSVVNPEFATLGGQDLAGYLDLRIVVHVDAATVDSPGSDPNGDGQWTTYSISGEVRFYATAPTLTQTVLLPAGDECAFGGRRFESGEDVDLDTVLDAAEVTQTTYACDGQDGRSVVMTSEAIPAGDTCVAGGSLVTAGYDDDGDGSIDQVSTTLTVCDGSAGEEGAISLIRLDPEAAGAHCVAGGQRVSAGVDQDGDGSLDDVEITSTAYVCSGTAGQDGTTGAPGADGASCTVSKSEDVVTITCPDGSSQVVPSGGCSATGGSSLLALLALGGLALRRRRRHA